MLYEVITYKFSVEVRLESVFGLIVVRGTQTTGDNQEIGMSNGIIQRIPDSLCQIGNGKSYNFV